MRFHAADASSQREPKASDKVRSRHSATLRDRSSRVCFTIALVAGRRRPTLAAEGIPCSAPLLGTVVFMPFDSLWSSGERTTLGRHRNRTYLKVNTAV